MADVLVVRRAPSHMTGKNSPLKFEIAGVTQ
jgi:hypothetical protein